MEQWMGYGLKQNSRVVEETTSDKKWKHFLGKDMFSLMSIKGCCMSALF